MTYPIPDPGLPWAIDYAGVLELAESEGYRTHAYQCDAGHWTCGRGETDGVSPTSVWTPEYIDQRFCDSIAERAAAVLAACTVTPTANQLAALTQFAYNYGGWKTSTVLKCHNRGDFLAAARAFDLVNKFRNPKTKQLEVSNGLTARRKREAARYLTQAEGAPSMPQEVAPESSMAASPINQSAAAGGVLATVKIVGDNVDAVKAPVDSIKSVLASFDVPAGAVPWAILLVLVGVILYQRFTQRKDGWA